MYAAISRSHIGVAENRLASGTGSVAVLYHLLQAYCEAGDEVVYAWRSFEAYPIAVSVTGATSVQVPVLADGRHDLDAMAAAVTDRTKAVIVCSPNNPTGPGRDRHRARGSSWPRCPPTCWSSSTRPTASSSAWTTRSMASPSPTSSRTWW